MSADTNSIVQYSTSFCKRASWRSQQRFMIVRRIPHGNHLATEQQGTLLNTPDDTRVKGGGLHKYN